MYCYGYFIAMTGKPESTLARLADVNLDVGVETEACPLDLAPPSSTTVALVMGDALAIALLGVTALAGVIVIRTTPSQG